MTFQISVYLIEILKTKRPFLIIEPAHMELAPPDIQTAVHRCIQQGADHITVFAYMLSPGRHATQDIPFLVKEALQQYSHISFEVIPGFGLDPRLGDIIWNKTNL